MFTVDLNDPSQFTRDNIARLLGSVTDTQAWQLRVRADGTAYMSSAVGNLALDGVVFRMGSFDMGTGYVGPDAQNDRRWVDQVYRTLRENWPDPQDSIDPAA
ncbi:hypothetical protein [Ramlibacter sp.]|uniref:hypothetical protein n=1 Tax=Ramlibacter sp. TaxID=1917967 RepID=UPI00262AFD99|nr:hypothetical protein [Ramlibacter sp.]MDB5957512.1 hypothetical protein [Ramlibacter sp.]